MKTYKGHIELEYNKGTKIKDVFLKSDIKKAVTEFNTYLDIILNQDLNILETRKLIKSNFNQYDIDIDDTIKEVFIKIFGDFN